jgi:glycosyltransferase involved in cell wall biosynthesis
MDGVRPFVPFFKAMSRPYRVFHLIKSLGRGGAETLLSEGQRHNNEKFSYAYGYFLPWKNALVSSLEEHKGKVICFNRSNFPGMILSIPAVSRFLKDWEVDLIHCHLPLAGVIGRVAGKMQHTPVIYTEHNLMERYHPWTRRLNLFTWKLQDHVIAVSSEVKSSIEKHAGSSVPVRVVHNGIPLDRFKPSREDRLKIRTEWKIPFDAPVFGTVAVFRPQKNLHAWLQAARMIRDRIPEVHFLLVGDGILMKELRATATSLNLNDVVHFTGLQNNVHPYFSAMDVFLSSSVFEGLPLSLLEAMAMTIPVVVTSVGGVPEVVTDRKTGLLLASSDPHLLADQACWLIQNEQARREFGLAGRRLIEERFSIQRMICDLEELYLEVLQRRKIAD